MVGAMKSDKIISQAVSSLFPSEMGHKIIVNALRFGLAPLVPKFQVLDSALQQEIFGLPFKNPIGMAAGFDKNAVAYPALFKMGFGFVEIGSVTLKKQSGNKGKRLWRLNQDHAVINRLGMPSVGMNKVIKRIRGNKIQTLGVNIAYNSASVDIYEDYYCLARELSEFCDYLSVNVSCPNVEGGKNLQSTEFLPPILQAVQKGIRSVNPNLPIMLKLSPDVNKKELSFICKSAKEHNVSALIVGNTTTSRPDSLQSRHKKHAGGLSGKPLFFLSTKKLAQAYLLCGKSMPLIGVGGIASAQDAYTKVRAGASLLQIYTGLVYEGSDLLDEILLELPKLLRSDGYRHISEAVGVDAKKLSV